MSGIQVGWGSQWETLANAITDYYGGGISSAQYQQVVQMLNSGNYTMQEMESIIGNIPEFNRTYNAAGQLTGVSYKATAAGNTAAGAAANAVNSNVASATQTQFSTVQNVTKNIQTGTVTMSDTVTKYSSGTAGTAKAVASSALAAVCAASAGIALGKMVDTLLYNANPDFWDENGMSSLNPETWSSIMAGDNSFGAKLFNFVFTIDDASDGNPQAYIDQNAFAYMAAYMASWGVFDTGDQQASYDFPTGYISVLDQPINLVNVSDVSIYRTTTGSTFTFEPITTGIMRGATYNNGANNICLAASDDPNAYIQRYQDGSPLSTYPLSNSYTYDNKTVYYTATSIVAVPPNNVLTPPANNTYNSLGDFGVAAWTMIYGDISGGGGVDGITPQAGVTQFNPSGIDPTDIDAILAALQSQYPDLWDNRIEVSPDGDNTIVYVPVGFPTGGTGIQPTTNGATANDLAPDISGDGENATDELIKTLIDMIQNPQDQNGMESDTDTPTEPIDPNMPNGGSGVTPPFVIPTGSASALYSVYNPSQAQLNSLGAWLWSSNFVDQLLKLFNDPMQAIIGLHKVFATPPTSGSGTIKVGYLDSGVGANLVSAQYTEIDCGSVSLPEYFKNALDYLKTDIYLYLPFVGIVPLNVEDVTRASINVKYKVDVLTGACLASVNVTRDAGGGGQLYVYAGNCAVQYPLSSGSYMGIVAGVLGIAGGVASSVLSGGALLPMALGAGASAMSNMRTKVEHSGSLSGNSGAMGIKKPYLIIRRPQTKIADNFQLLAGESQNEYGVLSSYTGQTRVKYVHLENIPATDNELTQIEELLKSGVLI